MSNLKCTPGPWSVNYIPTSVGGCLKIEPINACLYADGMRHPYAVKDAAFDEVKANANLLAAARELLETAISVIKHTSTAYVCSDAQASALSDLQDAIYKATGGQL